MEIYVDKNNGKELFSSVYKIKVIEDVIFEVEGETVVKSDDLSNVNTGANASAEEAAEDFDVAVVRGPDFVINSQLSKLETPLKKKEFQLYLKNKYLPILMLDDAKKKKVGEYFKDNVFGKFKEFDQYVGQDEIVDPEDNKIPMICLLNYREDTDNPYMICFKDGVNIEKV